MAFYDDYKPFRNYMRRFDLLEALVDVWRYSLHIMEGQPLPADYAVGKEKLTLKPLDEHLYPWQLNILTRELVLNSGRGGNRSLKRWNDLAIACNHMRRLGDAAYTRGGDPPDVLFELHRIAHFQFPWQSDNGYEPLLRAFKVFGDTAVDALIVRELGMTMQQFILLGTAVGGHFRHSWGMTDQQDYSQALLVSKDASKAFFDRMSCTIQQLRTETASRQSYGNDWEYAWNPLEETPLVRIDPAHPDRIVCPIPRYLVRRASTGIFFDLVKSSGFDNAYGPAFQAYTGEVIGQTCPSPRFTVLAEHPYTVGTDLYHGVDWIVSDTTGHLFIECKTKRLTLSAKTLSDTTALDRDLLVMAKAIVQHYGNIRRALEGKTRWVPNGLPVYPMILTLENWYVFSPRVGEMLKGHVHHLSGVAGIPASMLEDMPWVIASSHEFEIATQVMAQVGIHTVMDGKVRLEHRNWSLLPFMSSTFPDEMKRVNRRLFPKDWNRLMPDEPQWRKT